MDIFIPLVNVITATVIATTPVQPVTPTYALPALGVGVPTQTTPDAATARPAALPEGVLWLNWTANCVDSKQWPMVYSYEYDQSHPVSGCDNMFLLVGNEGESQYQGDDTPAQMAELLYKYRDRPLYCCGSLSSERGWWYTMAVLGEYVYRYDAPPPLAGIHFHVYRHVSQPYDLALLARWRWLSEWLDVPIVLSEWAVEGRTQEGTAAAMKPDLRALQDALGGRVWIAFWFSWSYPGYAATDLRRGGEWTVVGERWLALVGQ